MTILIKARAFIERDLIIESSYKVAFGFEVLRSLFPLFSFYYVSRLIGRAGKSGPLAEEGGYFSFVIVGVALSSYFMHAVHSFGGIVRRAQTTGCLEALLSTRTSPETVILLSPLYSFLTKTLHIALVFLVGGVFLGVDYRRCDLLSVVLMVGLAIPAFCGLGILSAAAIVMLKKADPIEWALASALTLVSGAYFPVDLLPPWLRALAACSPMTYALDGMRLALFRGHTPPMLADKLLPLGAMAAVLLAAGVLSFGWAVERGRREGTLLDY
jgi:ABC-2 type transport system permease protein